MTFNIPGLEKGKIASRMRDNIGGGDWKSSPPRLA